MISRREMLGLISTGAATSILIQCAPPPADSGVPVGSSDTGPSGSLTMSGSITATQDGQVISNKHIMGVVRAAADNVTIKNCLIMGGGSPVVIQNTGHRGLTVDHCEINGAGSSEQGVISYSGQKITVHRCDIHHVGNGVQFANDATVTENYIHDIVQEGGWHPDGLQASGGTNGQVLRNRVECPGRGDSEWATSCIGIWADLGNVKDYLVQDNVVSGAGFIFYAGTNNGTGHTATNLRFIDNVIRRQPEPLYGVWYENQPISPDVVRSGNHYEDGEPV